MRRLLLLTMLLFVFSVGVFAQPTRPRSTRIITATAWPYGTPEVGDEWVDTSVSPAETRNCLTAGVWSTVAVLSPDGTSSNTINGASQTVQIAMSQYRGVGVTITGTWVGTLVPELSMDGGSSWTAGQFYTESAGLSTSTAVNLAASVVVHGGVSHVRIRSSAWTSGTATIALRATEISTPLVSTLSRVAPSSLATLLNAVTANGAGAAADVSGYTTASFVVTGTFDATVSFEGSVDGTNWFLLTSVPWDSGGFWNTSYSNPGSYVTQIGGISQVRARIEDYASGSITVKVLASLAMSTISFKGIEMIPSAPVRIWGSAGNVFDAPISEWPAPPNQIVTGGVYNSTKPTLTNGQSVAVQVDTKGNQLTAIRDAAGNDRGANVDASNRLLVSVENTPNVAVTSSSLPSGAATSTKQSDGSQKTQVVDGSGNVIGSTGNALDINIKSGNPTSITANAGTNLNTSALALAATQTDGTQKTRVTDGTNDATVKAASTAAVASDKALVVAVSPNNTVGVTGTFWQATQPVSVAATLNTNATIQNSSLVVTQSIATDLKTQAETYQGGSAVGAGNPLQVSLANTGANATAVKIDGSAVTQPISAASLPLPSTAATSTKQSDGSQKTQVVDGSGNVISSTANALDINIKSGNPTSITLTPGTTNGASTCVVQSAASTNATNCKGAAGLLYGVEVINTTSTIYYLRLYNLSSAPTCSSATGFIRTIPVPHGSGAGAGIANFYTVGETYGTGIGFCLTGGGSSTDNTNAATGVYITLHYK